jgi:hypothetical protein
LKKSLEKNDRKHRIPKRFIDDESDEDASSNITLPQSKK